MPVAQTPTVEGEGPIAVPSVPPLAAPPVQPAQAEPVGMESQTAAPAIPQTSVVQGGRGVAPTPSVQRAPAEPEAPMPPAPPKPVSATSAPQAEPVSEMPAPAVPPVVPVSQTPPPSLVERTPAEGAPAEPTRVAQMPAARVGLPSVQRAQAEPVTPEPSEPFPARPPVKAPLPLSTVQRTLRAPAEQESQTPAGTGDVLQMAVLPQARVGDRGAGASTGDRLPLSRRSWMRAPPTHSTARKEADLPLPPVRSVSREQVQRKTDGEGSPISEGIGTVSGSVGIIQRVEIRSPGAPPEVSQMPGGGGGADLEQMARKVYPYIKRLLAAERERRTGRWR